MEERQATGHAEGQGGFALIMALLALMLLTFLGLTLATSTSTELQISNNYRWSLQSFYNAEAGIEAAKAVLSQMVDASPVLPDPRPAWNPALPPVITPPVPRLARDDAYGNPTRNFENSACDTRGHGAGYGAVFDDGTNNLQNVSTLFGQTLNGAFTVWIRRPLVLDRTTGTMTDDLNNEVLILVSEGTAPYSGAVLGGNRAQERRARRIIEEEVTITPPCDPGKPQGTTFGGCWQ